MGIAASDHAHGENMFVCRHGFLQRYAIGNLRVSFYHPLHFHRRYPIAKGIDHVISSTEKPKISIFVSAGIIPR